MIDKNILNVNDNDLIEILLFGDCIVQKEIRL